MATSIPFPKAGGKITAKQPKRRWLRWTILIVVLAAIAGGSYYWWKSRNATTQTISTSRVTQADIAASVSGSGTVEPARSSNVAFRQDGTITEVDVKVGDTVTQGQTLATIDTADLNLALQQAQSNLKSAQANLAKVQQGSTPEEISNAKAALESARAQLQQTKTGTATKADITSAQAALAAAQSKLDALKNPTQAALSAAQITLSQTQTNLQSQTTSLSEAKTSAQNSMDQATNSLTQAQTSYATAKQNWEYVQERGKDPSASGSDTSTKLTDVKRQQYYDTFVQAQASLNNAETAVQQAQLNYDTARQNEVTQIPLLQQQVANAQTQFDALKNPSANDLKQAQTSVIQAQAALTKLQQGGTAAAITQSQASVTQAQNNLATASQGATASDLASAEASVTASQVSLATAQNNLNNAAIKAPFAGVVSVADAVVGNNTTSDTTSFTVVDTSTLHINVSLSESDSAKVKATQPVTLTFDALPETTIKGTVSSVAPVATTTSNVVTYLVQIDFLPGDAATKVGMSATAAIEVARNSNAILVPSRAITTSGNTKTVTIIQGVGAAGGNAPGANASGARANGTSAISNTSAISGTNGTRRGTRAGTGGTNNSSGITGFFSRLFGTSNRNSLSSLPQTKVTVTTGITSNSMTEILTSGGNGVPALKQGDVVVLPTTTATTTTTNNQRNNSGFGGITGGGGPGGGGGRP